jgi:hypothetical protein
MKTLTHEHINTIEIKTINEYEHEENDSGRVAIGIG